MKIRTSGVDFCRYEPGADTIQLQLSELTPGAPITLELAREGGRAVVTLPAITPVGATATAAISLNTPAADGICYVNTGRHVVVARDANGAELARSRTLHVSPIMPETFLRSYLFGVPLHAEDVLQVVAQPTIPGVRVGYIDPYMLKGQGALTYTNTGKLLSWRGGPAAAVSGTDPQTLRLLTPTQDSYLEVEVDPELLPGADAANTLLVDNLRMGTADVRAYLVNATAQAAQDLRIRIEPAIVVTEDDGLGPFDVITEALAREPNQVRHLMFPGTVARPLLRVDRLEGWYANQKALTLPPEWFTIESKAGGLTLLPIQGAATLQITSGLLWGFSAARLGGSAYIPGFWHFRIVAGLRSLDHQRYSVRELIAIRAALKMLEDLGLGATGGRTQRSAQRDGVSESWSYGQGGYSEKIMAYREWLQTNVPKIRQYHAGMDVVVL